MPSSVWFSLATALVALLTSGSAAAAEAEPAPPLPLSEQETRAPTHADCDHRVPLWEHTVQPGESLGLIAGRYGVRREQVTALNQQLANPDHIVPGQKIRVCPEIAPRLRTQVSYVVLPGDSLSTIAEHHDLSLEELIDQLRDTPARSIAEQPRRLRAGQTLSFWVDGGVVEDFLPPVREAKRGGSGGSGGRARARKYSRVDVQLSSTDDVYIKRPHLAFGTKKTIELVESAVRKYKRRHHNSPKVVIGDISKRGGGQLHPHASHQRGVDIDLGYVLKGEAATRTRFAGVDKTNLDLGRTWALVKAFIDTDAVVYIFMDYQIQKQLYEYALGRGVSKDELDGLFQYPRGRGRSHGIIRHWQSHKNHFHVRFRVP